MTLRKKSSATPRNCASLLAAVLVLACSARVQAAAISYSLMMCENLDVLKSPMNKTLAMNAAWKPQHALMLERTMPFFELRNTSEEEGAVIKQISLSIGDTSKNFDWGKMIEASPGVTFSLASADQITGGAKTDTLVINLSGLTKGGFVRFRTGLSPDSASQSAIQDYRMTLFKLDGNDPSNNSVVAVTFADGDVEKILEKQMPNYGMMGMPTSTTMAFPHHYMDMVMPFELTDEGTLPPDEGPEVPEPGSLVLLGTGALGMAAWRFKRRRQRRAPG